MKYINLIDKLTEHDKNVINAYINKFGCNSKYFIGLDKWLSAWSHSNQKLYKALGNSFIREFEYRYEKDTDTIYNEINDLLKYNSFKTDYHLFYISYIKTQPWITFEQRTFFNHLMDNDNFVNEKIMFSLKLKKPEAKKMLQIQAGTKPIKALGRVIEYFADDYEFTELKAFEELKKAYAIILSEKIVKGRFCISIHPMDFITMSDNASNWKSCMSWEDDGCYHVGTVEMMNSNNVVCAYLLNDNSQYIFDSNYIDPKTGEILGAWNNKRWRQLFYLTKDIVMGGKSYPYKSKELTLAVLEQLKELAKENLGWDYTFGPELYQDMIHISHIGDIEKQKTWARIEKRKPVKHNIIWDTKGMYNDMLNDHMTNYWCFRNKTNHTKVISVSGKAPCLCCGESVLSEDSDWEDYNDRYDNTESVVCKDCMYDLFTCDCCDTHSPRKKYYKLTNGKTVCERCLQYIKICPCCGELFYNTDYNAINTCTYNNYLYDYLKNGNPLPENKDYRNLYTNDLDELSEEETDERLKDTISQIQTALADPEERAVLRLEKFMIHYKCQNKILEEFKKNSIPVAFKSFWRSEPEYKYIVDPAVCEQYRNFNLVTPDLESIIIPESEVAS